MTHTDTPININQQEFDDMCSHEAVVIAEFERADGTRFANIAGYGDTDEMTDLANTTEILVVMNGVKVVGKQVLQVSDLISQE